MIKRRLLAAVLIITVGFSIHTIRVSADTNNTAIDSQISGIASSISEELEMDEYIVNEIYKLLRYDSTDIQYRDMFPSVYFDTMQEEYIGFKGVLTKYQYMNSISYTSEYLSRPSGLYLPDALYSICYDLKTIMQKRIYTSRGSAQYYFNSLNEDIKQLLVLSEAVIVYTSNEDINNNKVLRAYELYANGYHSNIANALRDCGILNEYSIALVQLIFDDNSEILDKDSFEDARDTYEMPYEIGYSSRENMMISAFSIVGKVRYTWAGGHQGASTIKGINPMWKEWEQLYPKTAIDEETGERNDGYGTCIKPSGSWCPIHGYNEDDRCIELDTFTKFEDYLKFRISSITSELKSIDKYIGMLDLDVEGVSAHRLDGLDCSGYTSWVFNQITNKYNIDSSAMYFTRQEGITSIAMGNSLMPGDIFAWTSHIVMIVGKARENSKAYITVEQTPNTLKFGAIYYSGASTGDIEHALYVAREANKLIGNVDEEPHSYCMNTVGYYDIEITDESTEIIGDIKSIEEIAVEPMESLGVNTESGDEYTEDNGDNTIESEPAETIKKAKVQYVDIGRFQDTFLDENVIVDGYSKSIENMLGEEIIAYIITKLPISYITGYSNYSGNLFDKSTVATDIGVRIIKEDSHE